MFSAPRLHAFVCLALGVAVSAAPAGSGANIDARTPDVYALTGGIGALLLGYPEGYAGEGDEDAYILKRQLPVDVVTTVDANLPNINFPIRRDLYELTGGIDALLFSSNVEDGEGSDSEEYILKRQLEALANLNIGGGLASNLGIQQAVRPNAGVATGAAPISSLPKRDLYDLTGGLGALIFGSGIDGGEESESDEYILRRQLAEIAGININVRDVYDATGGLGALLFGLEGHGGGKDEDAYILRRQLGGLDVASRLGSNMGVQHAVPLAEAGLSLGGDVESA